MGVHSLPAGDKLRVGGQESGPQAKSNASRPHRNVLDRGGGLAALEP